MIERVYQIVLFIGTGALLVAGGFLYARFGKRIVKLVRDGTSAGAVLVVLCAAGRADAAPHFDVTRHEWMRAIGPIPAPGDYRVSVDFDLYRRSKGSGLLDDVRIVDEEQREVPYVLYSIDTISPPPPVYAEMLDPGTSPDGTAVATFKLRGGPHCKMKLALDGENFVRRVRVETGDAASALHTVSDGAYVFSISSPTHIERSDVTYPRSIAPYLRITLAADETKGAKVSIRAATFACDPAWELPATEPLALTIEASHEDAAKKTTVVTLDAGQPGVPITALVLDVDGAEFQRHVQVTATNYRDAWPIAGSGDIYRLRPRPAASIESLRVPVTSSKRWFTIEIENLDSPPVTVKGVRAEVMTRQIVFRAQAAGRHQLLVGDPAATRPSYDLGSILAQKEDAPAITLAKMGAAEKNPRFGEQPAPPDPPFTEKHRGPIGVALVVLAFALALWAARVLRKPAA